MSKISAAVTNIITKTPLSSTFGVVGLPTEQDEPLLTSERVSCLEKCEVRIEGMTCGSCVEVSQLLDNRYVVPITLPFRAGNRRYASWPGWHSFGQSCSLGRARGHRIRP